MSRPYAPRNQKTHNCLTSWASYEVMVTETSVLGARIIDWNASRSGNPGPLIPETMTPEDIVQTQYAIDAQSSVVQRHIRSYYLWHREHPLYVKVTPKAREHMLKMVGKRLFV